MKDMSDEIVDIQASKAYKNEYTEYAVYVQKNRTTPEFRDGLKPVQRRIIWAAHHITHANTKRKSASIVGDTMGHYHPHGDSSILGALYNMVNWYQTKIPLFNGQGNFGNTFENVPAAGRYTETYLSDFTKECVIADSSLSLKIIDWTETFDASDVEPEFLPVKIPLLLVNGCYGIAVGHKVDIPTHNLNEVIDATIALIKNPSCKPILIPDHCQKCEIVDTDWVDINNKGYGNYTVRGVIDIEPYAGENKRYKDCMTLVIKSCPNLTFLDSVVEKIEKMVKENKIIGIMDLEEQSTDNNMRYVVVLKPGTDPGFVKTALYKNTQLQQTARINFRVLDYADKVEPIKRLSYKQFLLSWIIFRKDTKVTTYTNLLTLYQTRLHKINNYLWAIKSDKITEIIDTIRSYKVKNGDTKSLEEKLISKFKITDVQAKFMLDCELKKLNNTYIDKFEEEKKDLLDKIDYMHNAVLHDNIIDDEIIKELEYIKNKYGEPRKCRIIKQSEVDGIQEGEFKIVITAGNFIKKMGVNDNIVKPKNDTIKFVLNADNSKHILLFDNMGRVYNMPVSKIPFADKNSSGIDIRVINKYINSPITSVIYGPILSHYKKGSLVTLSKMGYIKRMTISDFESVPASGLVYCKLDSGDSIVDLMLSNGNTEIIIYGDKKALKININEIPLLKRNARGCISMSNKNVTVEGIAIMSKNDTSIVVVTKNGYVNKIIPDSINTGRAKAGSNVIHLNKTDNIVSIFGCNESSVLQFTTLPDGIVTDIPIKNIQQGTTLSNGVKVVKGEVLSVYKK